MGKLNVKPRTIFCHDNLDVLRGMSSECIDLIYLDPPFNKNDIFTAPIGTTAEGAKFEDIWGEEKIKDDWVREIEQNNEHLRAFLKSVKEFSSIPNYCYLVYMAIRLIEMKKLLKNTGSIYYHCDHSMSHFIRMMMDCIFGVKSFKNEIAWCYTGPSNTKRWFPRKHDNIFYYTKTDKWVFNGHNVRVPYEKLRTGTSKSGIFTENAILDKKGKIVEDWWENISPSGRLSNERTGYPTQKPLALLERIVKASSNRNDVVLDPFCGCATTCVAAERLERRWIGIDISYKAYELVKERLNKEVPADLFRGEPNFETDPPKQSINVAREKKYVYIISNKKSKGEYKIGVTKNIGSRLNSYQIGDPDRGFKIEYKKLTPYYNEIERHIHQIFPNKYEWVQGSTDAIKAAIENWKPIENDELDI